MKNALSIVLALSALALSGCSGTGDGLDENGRPLGESLPLVPLNVQEIFDDNCIACHSGAGAPQGLGLAVTESYDKLVGVASGQQPSFPLVDPGFPDNSYLVMKLEGDPAISPYAQMPVGYPPLAQATIDIIRQWVTDGASPRE